MNLVLTKFRFSWEFSFVACLVLFWLHNHSIWIERLLIGLFDDYVWGVLALFGKISQKLVENSMSWFMSVIGIWNAYLLEPLVDMQSLWCAYLWHPGVENVYSLILRSTRVGNAYMMSCCGSSFWIVVLRVTLVLLVVSGH